MDDENRAARRRHVLEILTDAPDEISGELNFANEGHFRLTKLLARNTVLATM